MVISCGGRGDLKDLFVFFDLRVVKKKIGWLVSRSS